MLLLGGCSHPGPFIPTAAYTAQTTLAIDGAYRTARRGVRPTYHPVAIPDEAPDPAPPEPAEPSASERGQDEEPTTTLASDPGTIKPYSPEWWAKDREEMERLRHRSRICRGC
jgi:hypothetical protein